MVRTRQEVESELQSAIKLRNDARNLLDEIDKKISKLEARLNLIDQEAEAARNSKGSYEGLGSAANKEAPSARREKINKQLAELQKQRVMAEKEVRAKQSYVQRLNTELSPLRSKSEIDKELSSAKKLQNDARAKRDQLAEKIQKMAAQNQTIDSSGNTILKLQADLKKAEQELKNKNSYVARLTKESNSKQEQQEKKEESKQSKPARQGKAAKAKAISPTVEGIKKIKIDDNADYALRMVPTYVQDFMKVNGMLPEDKASMNTRQLKEYLKTADLSEEQSAKLKEYLQDKEARKAEFEAYTKDPTKKSMKEDYAKANEQKKALEQISDRGIISLEETTKKALGEEIKRTIPNREDLKGLNGKVNSLDIPLVKVGKTEVIKDNGKKKEKDAIFVTEGDKTYTLTKAMVKDVRKAEGKDAFPSWKKMKKAAEKGMLSPDIVKSCCSKYDTNKVKSSVTFETSKDTKEAEASLRRENTMSAEEKLVFAQWLKSQGKDHLS